MKLQTVCLNMIVKNESRVIERCLASLKNLIDYWVIVDTGSTDGTQEIIRNQMKDIPGELIERPWVDFAHNRNEALDFAKGKSDYLLFIDADEVLQYDESYKIPLLQKDFYFILYHHEINSSQRVFMVNNHLDWKWKGVLHEYIDYSNKSMGIISDIAIVASSREGARSRDPYKIFKDIEILEKEIEKDPDNVRYVFHLALSYVTSHQYPQALKMYAKRARMGGDRYQVFYSLYQIAALQAELRMDPEIYINNYYQAFQYCPSRAEPLCAVADYYITQNQFFLSYLLLKLALKIPYPNFAFFTPLWLYEWGILYRFAMSALEIKKYDEAHSAMEKLVKFKNLPDDIRSDLTSILNSRKQVTL